MQFKHEFVQGNLTGDSVTHTGVVYLDLVVLWLAAH
jgi:hypothetical protein